VQLESIIGKPGNYFIVSDNSLPTRDLSPDNDATIFYTSGTTGFPKGALSSHRSICTATMNAAVGVARAALRRGATIEDLAKPAPSLTLLVATPLFHVMGCFTQLVPALVAGAKIVLLRKWDTAQAVELIEKEEVTHFTGVPSMLLQTWMKFNPSKSR
jgi:long-chain acyl-CoA synthetase